MATAPGKNTERRTGGPKRLAVAAISVFSEAQGPEGMVACEEAAEAASALGVDGVAQDGVGEREREAFPEGSEAWALRLVL